MALYEQYVRLFLRVLKFGGIIGVRWSLSHIHVLSIQYTTMAMAALRWYSFIKCMERGRVLRPERTESTLVMLRVRLNLTLLFTFDAVWVRNSTRMRYFAIQTHYNDNDESALTGWMHAMGVVLARNEQHVRLYYCAWTWRRYWRTQYEVLVSPSWCAVQIYTLQLRWRRLCVDLHSLFECMERVSIRAYVCISVCARSLEFEAIIGVRCSMYEIEL